MFEWQIDKLKKKIYSNMENKEEMKKTKLMVQALIRQEDMVI